MTSPADLGFSNGESKRQQTKNALEFLFPHSLVYYKIYINKDTSPTCHKIIRTIF
jgi:hypothetical protein